MSISCEEGRGKRRERPGACRLCGAAAWWNGSRVVSAVVCGLASAVEYASEQVRRRARCSDRDCPAPGWTVYPAGTYPHRTFQLDVVGSAVAQVAAGESARQAGERHQCSRRSVGRWRRWCAQLVVPEELAVAVVRLDPDGLPPPMGGGTEVKDPGGWALRLWERLADVLAHRAWPCPAGAVDFSGCWPGSTSVTASWSG